MRLLEAFSIATLSVLMCAAGQSQTKPKAARPVFSLSIQAVQPTVSATMPIRIKIKLTNSSDHTILVQEDRGGSKYNDYILTVKNLNDKEPRRTNLHKALRGDPTDTPMVIETNAFRVL